MVLALKTVSGPAGLASTSGRYVAMIYTCAKEAVSACTVPVAEAVVRMPRSLIIDQGRNTKHIDKFMPALRSMPCIPLATVHLMQSLVDVTCGAHLVAMQFGVWNFVCINHESSSLQVAWSVGQS